jgi:tetratricopeptide (TPR) repeat protein
MADPVSLKDARALREEASRSEADLLAYEARIDHLQRAYRDAAAKYAKAAALVRPFDREGELRFIVQQAVELYEHGHECDSNSALQEAIALYRYALTLAPQAERPIDGAMAQHDLSIALQTLGDLTGRSGHPGASGYRGCGRQGARQLWRL